MDTRGPKVRLGGVNLLTTLANKRHRDSCLWIRLWLGPGERGCHVTKLSKGDYLNSVNESLRPHRLFGIPQHLSTCGWHAIRACGRIRRWVQTTQRQARGSAGVSGIAVCLLGDGPGYRSLLETRCRYR